MTKKQEKTEEFSHAKEILLEVLKPGDTAYTLLRHVSSSGMSRSISVLIVKDNKIKDITYYVSKVLDWSIDKNHGGIKVGGCGMDMGFHLVYSLSHVLFKNIIKSSDAGYTLKQNWL